jgi:uncharacterized phage-associated protein
MGKKFEFNRQKFAELILYLAQESEGDRLFGSTKLNKLLFAADFWAYGFLGKPITGATYVHLQLGPGPRELMDVRDELTREGRLSIEEHAMFGGRVQKRPVAESNPNLSVFTREELQLCHTVLDVFKHMGAGDISDWSHRALGWLLTDDGEEIPYETVFVWRDEPITPSDMRRAQELLAARQKEAA